jgi:peptide-methionine (S)-S-oxide reductase
MRTSRRNAALLFGLLLAGGGLLLTVGSRAEPGRAIPAPAVDETPGGEATEATVVAGGCFWGVQAVFQHVDGVIGAVSGYAGGAQEKAQYETVSTGRTGHAESVRITFDPRRISFGRILQIYFAVAHDPTQLNEQFPDRGTQYRSTIFPTSARQAEIAKAYIAQLAAAHAFDAPIVTTIEPDRAFYPAEGYHQDFLARHPNNPYIVAYDLPKLTALHRVFPDLYRADPVLVAAGD